MKRLKPFVLPVLLLAVSIAGFMLLKATRPEAPPVDEEQRRWPVAAISVEKAPLNPAVRLFGQIDTAALTSIRSRSAGDIEQVQVQVGDWVQAGDPLIQLDPLDAQAERDLKQAERDDLLAQREQRLAQHQTDLQSLAQERELLALAERQLTRYRQLVQANRVSERDVELAEQSLRQQRLAVLQRELAVEQHPARLQQLNAALQRAETQLQLAERNLHATELLAPEASRVVALLVSPGDRVTANTTLATLVVPQRIELLANLPLRYVTEVQAAVAAQQPVWVEALIDGQAYRFVLERFAAQTDRSASVTGYFRLVSGDASLLPLGRFVEAHMTLPVQADSIWVPTSALYGRDRVYRIQQGVLQPVKVELLGEFEQHQQPGFLLRADVLAEGDLLLASRLPQAIEGLAVEVVGSQP